MIILLNVKNFFKKNIIIKKYKFKKLIFYYYTLYIIQTLNN